MADINNNYKRFQTYNASKQQNTFRQDYMEQNYKVEKRPIGEKCELGERRELPKVDSSFIERSVRLDVNNQGRFMKK